MTKAEEFQARMAAIDRLSALPEIERYGDGLDRHFPEALLEVEHEEEQLRAAIAPRPVSATCSTEYRAIRSSGRRRLAEIDLLVVHSTQGTTARGAARWFTNPACRGSAHVVVDGLECFRTLPPSAIPWGAPGCNGRGWHLEIAGMAQWTRAEWLARRGTIERAAFKLAWHGRAFGIPMQRLTNAQLRAGRSSGIIDHDQASQVFGGTHWDVGDGFPMDVLLARARVYRKEIST